jgi:hypothetical protein
MKNTIFCADRLRRPASKIKIYFYCRLELLTDSIKNLSVTINYFSASVRIMACEKFDADVDWYHTFMSTVGNHCINNSFDAQCLHRFSARTKLSIVNLSIYQMWRI